MPSVVAAAHQLLAGGIATTTRALYDCGIARYDAFAAAAGIAPAYPASEDTLCLFVAALTSLHGLAASTARAYIAGVSHAHAARGVPILTGSMRLLQQTLEGAQRAGRRARPACPPVTLADVIAAHTTPPTTYNGKLALAAMMLAAACGLRPSELLGSPAHPSRYLRVSALQLFRADGSALPIATALASPDSISAHASCTIGAQKTDQHGSGTSIVLAAPRAISALLAALRQHPAPLDDAPLLVFADGSPLTQQHLLTARTSRGGWSSPRNGTAAHSYRRSNASRCSRSALTRAGRGSAPCCCVSATRQRRRAGCMDAGRRPSWPPPSAHSPSLCLTSNYARSLSPRRRGQRRSPGNASASAVTATRSCSC